MRAGGFDQATSAVISTAPISVLPKLIEGTDALEPYRAFQFRGLVLVNLKLHGRGLLPDTMMWFPQGDYPFFRLCEAPLSMPWLAPEGSTMITADIGASVGDERWTMADDDLIALDASTTSPGSAPTPTPATSAARSCASRSATPSSTPPTRPTASAWSTAPASRAS